MNKVEKFTTQNPKQILWLRLKRLTKVESARELLKSKGLDISEEILDRKAIGLSTVMQNGLDYWGSDTNSLSTWVFTRYYGLMQMTIAEQIASDRTIADLAEIQKFTKFGHGMSLFQRDEESSDFPRKTYLYMLKEGYFVSYLRFLQIDISSFLIAKRLKEYPGNSSESAKLVTMADLFRRIPELQKIIFEYLHQEPLSFPIEKYNDAYEKIGIKNDYPSEQRATRLELLVERKYSDEQVKNLNSLGLKIKEIKKTDDSNDQYQHIVGCFPHSSLNWYEELSLYRSSDCGVSVIAPLYGTIENVVPIHLMLLYGLSIISRYMPEQWYEICNGKLGHIASLIEHYLTIFDNTVPKIMLERITGSKTIFSIPGTWTNALLEI